MAWFKRNAHPEDQLSAFVDGELGPAARRSVQAHLAGCEACASLLEDMQAAKSMLAALPQLQPRRSFALGPEFALEQRREPRRAAWTFAPVAALTVFLALVAVDVASFGSSANDAGDALTTAASRQSEADKAGNAETFQAAGADETAAPGAGSDGAIPAGTPPGVAMPSARDDDAGGEQRDTFAGPQAPDEAPVIAPAGDQASSDGTSLLRVLEASAAVAFAVSLLIVLWPRIRKW